MSYTIKPITQYAVINNDNGLPRAVCKDRGEAQAIVHMMAGHGTWQSPVDGKVHKLRDAGHPCTLSDWSRH
jgi:hypothetical protein